MTTIEEYLEAINWFATTLEANSSEAFELIVSRLKGGSEEAERCVTFRRSISTEAELNNMKRYLEISYFPDTDEVRSCAWWLFYFDIIFARDDLELKAICTPYDRDQPLFQSTPSLFNFIRRRRSDAGNAEPDYELIDEAAVQSIGNSEVFKLRNGFAKLAPQLRPQIPAWARSQFPTSPRYLRLDPRYWYAEQPLMLLQEAAIVPANPRWMQTLALFPSQKTFAAYELQNCDPKSDIAQFRDYSARGIRKLEVTAQRREVDYLCMMLEELPRSDHPNGLMIGRCIHLDTRALVGTPMSSARLQHLDLAINIYRGEQRNYRTGTSLQNGKVCDATYRTHLYRIEDVPFLALFEFARMFFESEFLLKEWLFDLGLDAVA